MIVVIIAGGSGSRLWPLSTPEFPKHLLKIGNSETSLLQNTYNRAKRVGKTVYVVTDGSHAEHVRSQLPELGADAFIVEPARRGTASCIIAALSRIAQTHDSDEPIAFMHADHYIRDIKSYVHSFKIANLVAQQEKRIVLIGVEPDYSATSFGYIEKGDLLDESLYVFNVTSFQEKPDYTTAQNYLKSGNYLWNCGYFVGSVTSFTKAMEQFAPELLVSYQLLLNSAEDTYDDKYLSLSTQAIDYALIEKVTNLLVVPAAFDWMDLGSYRDLAKAVGSDEKGNYQAGELIETEDTYNTFVQNHEDKPVVVIGMDNCVVVNTPQGILVTRKDLSQKVSEVSKRLKL
ncbi:NTP transferase domain-containing protein [Candidatus Saccharibacteria bacterium]|nr:NTP transferase domain-containing protein [Candidatus Saccharibacteria bacterium]